MHMRAPRSAGSALRARRIEESPRPAHRPADPHEPCSPEKAIDKVIDMNTDPRKPTQPESGQAPDVDHLSDALDHLSSAVETNSIASGAAKGLVYSIIETLGTLVGDPDLPEHARSGYEGLLETAREIRARLEGGTH
jgi:hypothetical protein